MPKPAPKTTRRRGKRRKFQPGFYLTPEAEKALGEIPSGKVSAYINKAIEDSTSLTIEEKINQVIIKNQ